MIPSFAKSSPIVLAAIWMLGTLFSFSAMAIAGRELSATLDTFNILFFRSLIGLFIVAFFLQRSGWGQVRWQHLKHHTSRNAAHFMGQYGWFYGIALLPLSQVIAIEFTLPIWAALFATLLLKEQLTPYRTAAIALGFIGILVIVRPGMTGMHPAIFFVLVGAMGYALSHVLTRKLTKDLQETPLAIIFFMTVIQLPVGLLFALPTWVTPDIALLPWIVVVGASALSAHYCMAKALQLAEAIVVAPMDFLRLPFITFLGYLLYGESLDIFVMLGVLIIFASNLLMIVNEQKKPARH